MSRQKGDAGSRRKPNILFISTDQHRWNVLSRYGCPWVKTPNLDRLHENGVSFMRSYSPDPVCAPARSSWWTGLYTSETGSVFNSAPVHDSIPDLGQILNASGYAAYHAGKWHVDGRPMERSFRNLYYGRKHIVASTAEPFDPATTHSAVSFLRSYEGEEPFFLAVEYINPHDICEHIHYQEATSLPTPVGLGILDEADLPPLPDNFDFTEQETGLMKATRREADFGVLRASGRAVHTWTEEQWRYYIWQYYRLVEKVDSEIGMVLRALESSRFKDDTLVVFTSDHGEALGSHRMFQKFTLYEESVRVPFIAACLGDGIDIAKDRFNRDHFVSGIDILPTVLDYAGLPIPENARGASLRPLLEGAEPSTWCTHVYAEHYYWGRMVIQGDDKYVTEYLPDRANEFVPPGPAPERIGVEQLFDLKSDPGETKNLAYDPAHRSVVGELRRILLDQERLLTRPSITDEHAQSEIQRLSDYIRAKAYPTSYPVV